MISNFENVVNQFVFETKTYVYFQSYKSVVVRVDKRTKEVTLGKDWNYSNTTRKYVYRFMRKYTNFYVETKKDVLSLISEKKVKFYNKRNVPM